MLRIQLLGNLFITHDGVPFRFSPLPGARSLFAYLLLLRDRPISRERLAGLFWGDVPESQARANLRRHLHSLNRSLPPDDRPWLLRMNQQVQWNPECDYWLDVAAFENAASEAARLPEAVAVYEGDLLPDIDDEWLVPERARLRHLFRQSLATLARRHEAQVDPDGALAVWEQLLAADPLEETALRAAMRLLFEWKRNRAGALQLFQQFQSRLAADLGVTPMAETVALYERIVSAQTIVAAPASPPHNLQAPLNSFVGRETEVDAVLAQIGEPASPTRLLTITGPPGSGKTRLGLTAAGRLLRPESPFPDGVFLVELAPLNRPEQVTAAIAAVIFDPLALKLPPGSTLESGVREALTSRRMLLVLDNFEHLLPAARLVHDLLGAAPGLRCLVTSQTPLRLYGETEFPLAPLALPDAGVQTDRRTLAEFAAAQLFVARVQAVKPDFRLDDANAATVAAICGQLDGLPLAIELAAARSKYFTLPALLAQLDERLHFLAETNRGRPGRQMALRAAIDWSYDLLTAGEQHLFNCLSVFAGSITFEAAATVADIDSSLLNRDLMSLVERNLVQMARAAPDEPRRVRMLGLMRDFGRDKLAESGTPAAAARWRWCNYYVDHVERLEKELYGSGQTGWLRWLRGETANLNAVFENLRRRADNGDAHLLLRFVLAMEAAWDFQGHFGEARQKLELVLSYQSQISAADEIRLRNKVGGMAQATGDYETAVAHHETALNLARRLEDPKAIASTLSFLGLATGRQGDYEAAQLLMEDSLASHRRQPDFEPSQIGSLLNNLAIVYRRLGQFDRAEQLLHETLADRRAANDRISIAGALSTLGGLAIEQGKLGKAAAYLQESLRLRVAIDDQKGLVHTLHHLAMLGVLQERWIYGVVLLAACAALRGKLNFPLPADFQADFDRAMAQIRTMLAPTALAANWEYGSTLSVTEAAGFAQDYPKIDHS